MFLSVGEMLDFKLSDSSKLGYYSDTRAAKFCDEL